jgi:hypothetical protein
MVEQLLGAQNAFGGSGKDTSVDIGYHYMQTSNLKHIKMNRLLLTKAEQDERGVVSKHNGSSTWGDGIYTGNNTFAFKNFGKTGILVAQLKGTTRDATQGVGPLLSHNTAIANKGTFKEMVILSQSFQCIPLLKFQRLVATNVAIKEKDKAIWCAHGKLQSLVDKHFNGGWVTKIFLAQKP